ncbi:ChaC family protein [Gloeocapsa sp. PCC 7428]|uniref:gamma-glutamylcyclotransferase n=1 Tax=Gloeocapsa sp. PCC 7428 TaxID=1173026 RepID=UPI0002A5CCFD|nr:gamma-glutamylcyclotransferase [Gloeocapsa sp. PCC 7428]AFZ33292.1 ChaC family protein [Gloeocapsa sp. PCC 7428]
MSDGQGMIALTRAYLESRKLQELVLQSGLDLRVLNETELEQSIQDILKGRSHSDVWIFAYGSLIWNPTVKFSDRRVGMIYGWHRRFCLWTPLGRGTPENPGLMLGLDRGGSCRGIAYRIPAEDVLTELLILWRREMVVGSYTPRWVKVVDGKERWDAIAFTINHNHVMYTGDISSEVVVNSLATANGKLGTCADYLLQTVNGLMQYGIQDKQLLKLQKEVIARQQSSTTLV